jgi:hypothetical protein
VEGETPIFSTRRLEGRWRDDPLVGPPEARAE